jgi:arylamine N-acetyltransferase
VSQATPRLDEDVVRAYLARLGLEREAPSLDALVRLHRAQVEQVPYETLWIHAGEDWGIDPRDSIGRIVHERRGGYCFHLNGAFSEVLRTLGYAVVRHVGGVHGPPGPDAQSLTNHLVLTVGDLPTNDNPGGTWYVDAGLGDALHEPLPLLAGPYEQGPYHLSLEATADGVGDWHLTHDPAGSFAGMSWRAAPTEMAAFADRHDWLRSSPDSGFVRLATVQRRDAAGVDIMRGLVLTRNGVGTAPAAPLTERGDWFGALADVFGLRFEHTPAEALDRLWANVLATHRAWEGSVLG